MAQVGKIVLWILKGLSGLVLAYVAALTGRELIKYGLFSFLFIVLSVAGAFLYLVKGLKFPGVLIVDAILVASAVLLRFYVQTAFEAG